MTSYDVVLGWLATSTPNLELAQQLAADFTQDAPGSSVVERPASERGGPRFDPSSEHGVPCA